MSNPDKPTQMQIAMEYLAAFCTAAVVAGFAGLVVATRQYPDDQSALSGITLAAGFLGGATGRAPCAERGSMPGQERAETASNLAGGSQL